VVKSGGQGTLYQGVDNGGKIYAVKKLLDQSGDPEERALALEMFEQEAKLLMQLDHPRIPRVYACFADSVGTRFMAQDYLIGRDLEEVLLFVLKQGRKLPVELVLRWGEQICEVLEYVHKMGLIFRDMKPSNVMMTKADYGITVVDFGNVSLINSIQTSIGTAGYAPKEQYRGKAKPVSDIYALAASLHYLLTGMDPTDNPFQFASLCSVRPDVPYYVAEAIHTALLEDDSKRPQTPSVFTAMLNGYDMAMVS
jgi:serine/threonine-protein kinase